MGKNIEIYKQLNVSFGLIEKYKELSHIFLAVHRFGIHLES